MHCCLANLITAATIYRVFALLQHETNANSLHHFFFVVVVEVIQVTLEIRICSIFGSSFDAVFSF